jgi:hypothetical protein
MSIFQGPVRRVSEAAMRAASTPTGSQERTMRFMIMAMMTKDSENGPPPTPEAFAAMQKYNEDLVKAGVLLAAEGLTPSAQAVRVTVNGDQRIVTDGPFAEAKEVVAGFSIIQVKSKEEAIEWVRRAPAGPGVVEIRRLMDIEDFGELLGGEFTPNAEVAKVKF